MQFVSLSVCEHELHAKIKHYGAAGEERRRPHFLQRSQNATFLLTSLAFFLLPPTRPLSPDSVWMHGPLGFSALLFSPQHSSPGVTMETGSGSCAGTDDERRRRRSRLEKGRGRVRLGIPDQQKS